MGLKARMRVKGSIDGRAFSSSLMPAGGGELFIVVNKPLRDAIGKLSGDTVTVSMTVDRKPMAIRVPSDLKQALEKRGRARSYFDGLAPSHRKAYVSWIEAAKRPETRKRRVNEAVELLSSKRKLA
jgi:hypothetical protein